MNGKRGKEAGSSKKGVKVLTLFMAFAVSLLVFTYHLFIPLPNPTPHPWRAKALWREFKIRSLWAALKGTSEFTPAYWYDAKTVFPEGVSPAETRDRAKVWELDTLKDVRALARKELDSEKPEIKKICDYAKFLAHFERVPEAVKLLDEAAGPWLKENDGTKRIPGLLLETMAVVQLMDAQYANCQALRSSKRCLYPMNVQRAVQKKESLENAFGYYAELVRRKPKDVGFRWLLDLTGMMLNREGEFSMDGMTVPKYGNAPFPRMEEVAARSGLWNLRSAGSAAVDDFNGDDKPDVFLGGGLPMVPLLYYQNLGEGNFQNRSSEAGLDGFFGAFRMSQADYDNDGDLDLVTVGDGMERPNRMALFKNRGDAHFANVAAETWLVETWGQPMEPAWGDYDNDGWVDLFIADMGRRSASRLYRNLEGRVFVETTKEARLPRLKIAASGSWDDYDNDGDLDLYASTFLGPNYLFDNQGDGTFQDVTFEAGVERPLLSFPAWFWDYDNDGNPDIFCGTFWPVARDEIANLFGASPPPATTQILYRNRGDGRFEDVTKAAGLDIVASTMGGNFGDLDSDGFLDLHLGTGSPPLWYLVPNRLFRNRDGLTFEDVTFSANVGHLQMGHGTAFADLDEDGDVDLLVNDGGAMPLNRFSATLFENPGNGNHWLEVKLEGVKSNRSAVGARIEATLPGGRKIFRTVLSGGPFGASPLRQWLGLGKTPRVERLEVRWPSGTVDVFHDLPTDNLLVVVEGKTKR